MLETAILYLMIESASPDIARNQKQAPETARMESPFHLDVAKLIEEKNCYFVHMIQVTDNIDVSENNKSINTKNLTNADKLDILYGANPTLSASTLRPRTQDGTFYGGFGVVVSRGEIVSASPGDEGTIASSLSERHIIGGAKNSEEHIQKAIDKSYGKEEGKSYNEIVLKSPEIAGGFMKIDNYSKRITYEDDTFDYGAGGGVVTKKIGVLNMANEKYGSVFDVPFSVLLEMDKRGPVFLMDENNELLMVRRIDEKARRIEFSTIPLTPKDIAELYSQQEPNKYAKQEMRSRLSDKGIAI